MASAKCTGWQARSYEGGWKDWYTDFTKAASDGYCYTSSKTNYSYCFSFKTPSISNFHKSTSLTITIPIIRLDSSYAKSGTLYFRITDTDPTGGKSRGAVLTPSSSNKDASCSWPADTICKSTTYPHVHNNTIDNQDVHKVRFTLTSDTLEPNKRYYVGVGGSAFIGIGYLGYTPENGWWAATFNYDTYTDGTAPTLTVTDLGDNRVKFSGTLGRTGTNNPFKSNDNAARIIYTTNNNNPRPGNAEGRIEVSLTPTSGGSYSHTIDITESCLVQAFTYCMFEHNDTIYPKEGTCSVNAKYYAPPGNPGKPTLTASSYKNNRLTIKQNWTFEWTAAEQGSTAAPVCGYRLRLFKNGSMIDIKDLAGNIISNIISNNDRAYDTKSTATQFTINPVMHGFKAGDTVHLTIFAYAKNGEKPTPATLWSGGGTASVSSNTYTVQNAGVVNVKTSDGWKEGQVWVKTSDGWKEAETVSVKTSDGWKESQ